MSERIEDAPTGDELAALLAVQRESLDQTEQANADRVRHRPLLLRLWDDLRRHLSALSLARKPSITTTSSLAEGIVQRQFGNRFRRVDLVPIREDDAHY